MDLSPPNDGLAGLRDLEKHLPAGIMPNVQHQDARGFLKAALYELAIVEFDDQGRCYQRAQLEEVSDRLEKMRADGEDAIVLVFVHGWKHDARSDDENLSAFRRILAQAATHEQATSAQHETEPRPVRGLFVGWRGLTTYGLDAIADTTFWGRQEAAHRVSTGSVRELFGRLHHYRNSRLQAPGGSPLLVIAGHSFGGMIVYSALAQSLIEAASAPVGYVATQFADLVLLVNPAIEGARYLPIYDLVSRAPFQQNTSAQLPVFVCLQAANDEPVGTFFPIGNAKNGFEEASIGDLEKRCVTHAIGFIKEFQTHTIVGTAGRNTFTLMPPDIQQRNPFWVVAADQFIIDGHGGIWQEPFLNFLTAVLFQHVNVSKAAHGVDGTASLSVSDAIVAKAKAAPASLQGGLADYAQKIAPQW